MTGSTSRRRGAIRRRKKGVYLLLLQLDESQQISIGRWGVQHFTRGFYAYVGSALNGLEARIKRHLSQNKKHHWHIDYLLDRACIYEVALVPTKERLECTLARALRKNLLCIRRFGSSDCHCPGHLFFATARNELETQVTRALADLGLAYCRRSHTCSLARTLVEQMINQ
jgi:Uri superfamily endonuclease